MPRRSLVSNKFRVVPGLGRPVRPWVMHSIPFALRPALERVASAAAVPAVVQPDYELHAEQIAAYEPPGPADALLGPAEADTFLAWNARRYLLQRALDECRSEPIGKAAALMLAELATAADRLRDRIVAANVGLVCTLARKYHAAGEQEDLQQTAFLCLMAAVDRFDARLGWRFSTYAGRVIAHGMRHRAAEEAGHVHAELAPERFLPAAPAPNEAAQHAREVVEQALKSADSRLSDRERLVLKLRFGLDGGPPVTLQCLGQQMGITRERARQIEAAALAKLRGVLVGGPQKAIAGSWRSGVVSR